MPEGVYRRGRTWSYVVELPPEITTETDPETGATRTVRRRRQQTKGGFRTQADARAARLKRLSEIEQQIAVNPARLTVADYLVIWLESGPGESPNTRQLYRWNVERRITPHLGHHPLRGLEPLHIERWHTALLNSGLAASTVGQAHMILSAALGRAVTVYRYLPFNPASLVQPPSGQLRTVTPWTVAQARAFMALADRDEDAAMWRVLVFCGLRAGELLALKWSDIDMDGSLMIVRRTLTRDDTLRIVIGERTKSKRTSVVPIPTRTLAALKQHRREQNELRLRAGSAWEDHDLVFPGLYGRRMHPSTLRRRFYLIQDRIAGLPRLHPHGARHTIASALAESGVHPEVIRDALRHSTTDTTDRVYISPSLDAIRAATDAWEAAVEVAG